MNLAIVYRAIGIAGTGFRFQYRVEFTKNIRPMRAGCSINYDRIISLLLKFWIRILSKGRPVNTLIKLRTLIYKIL